MMTDLKALQSIVEAAAPPDRRLSFRPMFGGIMAYADGRPFASLSTIGLGLKLHGANHAEMLTLEGATGLRVAADYPATKLDFTRNKAYATYAPNGAIKSSLANAATLCFP